MRHRTRQKCARIFHRDPWPGRPLLRGRHAAEKAENRGHRRPAVGQGRAGRCGTIPNSALMLATAGAMPSDGSAAAITGSAPAERGRCARGGDFRRPAKRPIDGPTSRRSQLSRCTTLILGSTPLPFLCFSSSLLFSPRLRLFTLPDRNMAHRRTLSARHPDMGKLALDSPPLTPPLSFADFSTQLSSRKLKNYWYRTTFLALFVLIVVSIYILLVAQPSLSPISFREADGSKAGSSSHLSSEVFRAALRQKRPIGGGGNTSNAERPQITLDAQQELAAVSSFIVSLPQNIIPSSVDPTQPIDPQLVLDFDTRSPQAPEEVATVVHDVWARNPVLLYSKVRISPRNTSGHSLWYSLPIVPLANLTRNQGNARRYVLTSRTHDY